MVDLKRRCAAWIVRWLVVPLAKAVTRLDPENAKVSVTKPAPKVSASEFGSLNLVLYAADACVRAWRAGDRDVRDDIASLDVALSAYRKAETEQR